MLPPRAQTKDNVSISIDGVLYVKVIDAYKASYGVEDPHFAITQLAQTTMRSEIGKLTLDNIFSEREKSTFGLRQEGFADLIVLAYFLENKSRLPRECPQDERLSRE